MEHSGTQWATGASGQNHAKEAVHPGVPRINQVLEILRNMLGVPPSRLLAIPRSRKAWPKGMLHAFIHPCTICMNEQT